MDEDMKQIRFTIPGQPFGKQRPKFSRAGAYVKTYTQKETTSYENLVKLFYNEAAKGKMFPEGAMLDVRIIAYYEIPKSTSKKKRREMLEHRIRPTKKPDWDNIGKIVCDSLNLVAYHDDSAVVDAQVRKFYSETPRVFLLVMFLTFYTLFSGKNLGEIANAVSKMSVGYLVPAAALAIFFVCAEGYMIWYLLQAMKANRRKEGSSLIRCIQYSFIGFFYSGITPSATGGQPVQLYYMSKDGNRGSDSTVVLMTVAVVYKFVLVILGAAILLFWYRPLYSELGKFFPLYLFGLLLNVILVVVIAGIMLMPNIMLRCALFFEKLFVKMSILKPSEKRPEKIHEFIGSYQNAVSWLRTHKGKLLFIVLVTFLQRCSVFLLTYMVYLGFGLHGTGMMKVILLQAAVYIAVDMLPLPGAQGITELMYQTVFAHVFTGTYLIPSMLVSRGINFYFLLIVSLIIVLVNKIRYKSTVCRNVKIENE